MGYVNKAVMSYIIKICCTNKPQNQNKLPTIDQLWEIAETWDHCQALVHQAQQGKEAFTIESEATEEVSPYQTPQ